ncbi:hypothetical protein D3C72_867730 [compost metagenome]
MNSQLNAIGLGALLILIAVAHPTGTRSTGLMQPDVAAVAAVAGASIEQSLVAPLREALESQVVGFIQAQRALHGLPSPGS